MNGPDWTVAGLNWAGWGKKEGGIHLSIPFALLCGLSVLHIYSVCMAWYGIAVLYSFFPFSSLLLLRYPLPYFTTLAFFLVVVASCKM